MEKTEFEAGDVILALESCSGMVEGETYILHKGTERDDYSYGKQSDMLWAYDGKLKGYSSGCHCQGNWRLVRRAGEKDLREGILC